MLRMLVGHCHAMDSNSDVIRYVVSRLRDKHQTWRALSREKRREIMREIIRMHDDNLTLFLAVQGGNL